MTKPAKPHDQVDLQLLERFAAGACSDQEREQVRALAARDPRVAALLAALGQDHARWNVDAAWAKIGARLRDASSASTVSSTPDSASQSAGRWPTGSLAYGTHARDRTRWPVWALAAALLLVVAGGSLVWQWRTARGIGTNAVETVHTTAKGARREITLPDGSLAILAPDSKLRVFATFGNAGRDVELTGAAFFTVTRDEKRPFIVHAGATVTQVLGTEFLVRAYPASDVRVVVASGRVLLRAARDPAGIVLSDGQLGTLGSDGLAVLRGGVNVGSQLRWTTGRVALADTRVSDVFAELAHWYDAELRVSDSTLAGRRVTIDVRGDSLPDVLDALALTLGARWERQGSAIVFAPRGKAR